MSGNKKWRILEALARKRVDAIPAATVDEAEEKLASALAAASSDDGRHYQAEWVVKLFPARVPIYYCPSLTVLDKKPLLCGSCGGDLLAAQLKMVEDEGVDLVPKGPGNTPGYGLRVIPLAAAGGFFCPSCGVLDKPRFLRSLNAIPKWLWVEAAGGKQFVAAFPLLVAIKGADEKALRDNSRRVAVGLKQKP